MSADSSDLQKLSCSGLTGSIKEVHLPPRPDFSTECEITRRCLECTAAWFCSHLVRTFPSFTVWPERSRTGYRHSLSDDTSGASSRNAGYAWHLPPSALLRHPLPEPSSRSHEEAASAEKGCSLIYSPARNKFGSVMRRRIENSYWRGEQGWMGAKRGGEGGLANRYPGFL
jgi:hypothetical protein